MISETYRDNEIVEYLDFASIKETVQGTVEVEELTDFASPRKTSAGNVYRSLRIVAEYNITMKRRRVLKKTACQDENGGGEVVFTSTQASDWHKVEPDSTDDQKIQALLKAERLGFW